MKTAAFDAENLIDEFQTLVDITKHVESSKKDPSHRRKRSIPYLGGFMTLVKRRRITEGIAKIEDRLDEIRKSRMNLGLEPSDGQQRSNGSNEMVCIPTSAKFDESRIFGRTKECDSVVAALKAKSVSNLHIVVIHDLPGIGKTTLAQLVFKHFSKGESSSNPSNNHFEMMIWVSLGKTCDDLKVIKEIIKHITGENCQLQIFIHLQNRLAELVKGKKFLLVLDHFCTKEPMLWERLRLPLLEGAEGSRVLITARNAGIWRGMTDAHFEQLQDLEKDDRRKLFNDITFPQANGDVDKKLKDINESIVDICQGLPLATISLGELLKFETNVDNWKTICNEILRLENNSICPILRSFMPSYHQLNYESKQCFALFF